MENLSESAKEKKRAYEKEYYQRNREKILEQKRKWRSENADKSQAYNNRYWEKKAGGASNGK
jgi:hypothetical protein